MFPEPLHLATWGYRQRAQLVSSGSFLVLFIWVQGPKGLEKLPPAMADGIALGFKFSLLGVSFLRK